MFHRDSFKQESFSPTSWRFDALAALAKGLGFLLRRRRR